MTNVGFLRKHIAHMAWNSAKDLIFSFKTSNVNFSARVETTVKPASSFPNILGLWEKLSGWMTDVCKE